MGLALLIALVVGGTFFFLWQDEHEKRIKAEKQIKDLNKQLKRVQKQSKPTRSSSRFATIEKSKGTDEFVIKKPRPKVCKPLLDQGKLAELQIQTRASQELLAEIFVQDEELLVDQINESDNRRMIEILSRLFEKEAWTRDEIQELAGPDIMIGSLLEQINDYSCSKIDDIVVEDDGDKIYVTTEYQTKLI